MKHRKALAKAHKAYPIETDEQRKERLTRLNALMEERKEYLDNIATIRNRTGPVKRTTPDNDALRIRRREVERLRRAAESDEETERRRIRERARWRARMDSMTKEELRQFVTARNAKYLEGRPDRIGRVKELARQAQARRKARMTDEDRRKLNEYNKLRRRAELAAMTPEEREADKQMRKEKLAARMEDPEYAARFKAAHVKRTQAWRKRKKEKEAQAAAAAVSEQT